MIFPSPLQDWDLLFFRALNEGWAHPLTDFVAIILSEYYIWTAIMLVTATIGIWKKNRRMIVLTGALLLAVGVSDVVCARVIKPWIARDRPCSYKDEIRVPAGCGGRYGFPSNHSSNAMAASVIFFAMTPAVWGWSMLFVTLGVGVSRVYLGVHYPSDVIAGFFLGALIGALTILCLRYLLRVRISSTSK